MTLTDSAETLLPSVRQPDIRRVLVAGPKGGIGKTTITRNLAVSAAVAGHRVATLDFDAQKSLTKWYAKRPDGLPDITHYEAAMTATDVRTVIREIEDYDLLFTDTPPSIEDHPDAFRALLLAADILLVPTGQSHDDLDSVRPWMTYVVQQGTLPAYYVLNRVKPRTTGFAAAKKTLLQSGRLCPVELPDYEDFQMTAAAGLGLVELARGKGSDSVTALWLFLARELSLVK